MTVALLEAPGLPLPASRALPETPQTPDTAGAARSCRLDPHNPWPGLAAYDEASRNYFHGREDDTVDLLRLIRVAPLAVLYGKSGLGKSSLLQAGVFPALRREHFLPVYLRVDFSERAHCPPLEQVARRLEEEIARAGAECPPRKPGEGLWQYLHRKDLEIWSADNFLLTPVLVLDQFEELFSRNGRDRERIRVVFDALADLIENRIPDELACATGDRERCGRLALNAQPYRIVLSFREDFLPDIESWKDKVPSLLRNRLRLLPMSREQAIAATEQAGAAVLDGGVAERIVEFVAPPDLDSAGAAPEVEPVLLSLCCTRLNRRRAAEGRIDARLVACAGGDILRDFLAEAMQGMPEGVPRFIETYLIQGDRYRGSYPRDAALAEGHLDARQLAALTDRHHLLRIDQQQGVARIELIHDRLVGVVRRARDERLAREREQQARRAWMQRGLGWAALVLLGLAGVAGWQAWTASRQALRATALRLAAESQGMFSGAQPEGGDRGLLQALAAERLAGGDADVGASLLAAWLLHGERKLITLDDTVAALAFTGDGAGIVSSGPGHALRIWDVASGQPTGTEFAGHREWVWAIAVSPDGRRLVSGSEDKTLRQWDVGTGREIGPPIRGHQYGVASLAISPDGSRIATGSWDNVLRLWDARSGKLVAALHGHGAPVAAIAFAPDGGRLVSGSGDGTLRRWDVRTGEDLGPLLPGHVGGVSTVAFSPDGRRIVSGGSDGLVRIRDGTTGLLLRELQGHTAAVMSLAISPDGRRIVSGSWDGTLRAWQADSGQPLGAAIAAHRGGVMKVTYSPDGRFIASGGVDKTLRLWDGELGWVRGEPLHGPSRGLRSTALSADGRLQVSGNADGSVNIQDGARGEILRSLAGGHQGPVLAVAVSPDGARVASAGEDKTVRLWDGASGTPLGTLAGHRRAVLSLAFSPDGSRLVSGSEDASLRLWDARRGEPLGGPLEGHLGGVLSVAFSPDGNYIASGSWDKTLRLWNAARGQPLGPPLAGHADSVLSVGFSPDGRHILSESKDGSLRRWPAPATWSGELCAKLTRNLSRKQWKEWVSADVAYECQCPGLPIAPDGAGSKATPESCPGELAPSAS